MLRQITLAIALLLAAANANALEVEIKEDMKTKAIGEEMLKITLFAQTAATEVPFRYKAEDEAKVIGYFPANTVVQVLHWGNPWVMVSFSDVAGWVNRDFLPLIVTPDGRSWVPQQ